MTPQERHDLIMDRLHREGRVSVEQLAEALGASRETIRRDLNVLYEKGALRKFHGGAELPHPDGEGAFRERLVQNAAAKRRIARVAAALFHPGDSLFVDTGTTTVYFAEELARVGGLSVITNSATIAATLAMAEIRNRVYLLGGEYHEEAAEMLGPLTVDQVGAFRADHVVLTVSAVDADAGMTDYLVEEAEVARAMLARAGRLTVVADSSKLGRTSLFDVCPLARVHTLVTDVLPHGRLAEALQDAGVRVISAGEGMASAARPASFARE